MFMTLTRWLTTVFVLSVCSVMSQCISCTDTDSDGVADRCSECSESYQVNSDNNGCTSKYTLVKNNTAVQSQKAVSAYRLLASHEQ